MPSSPGGLACLVPYSSQRDERLRSFYLQKNAKVTYYRFPKKHKLVGDLVRKGTFRTYNTPMQVVRIFPGHTHFVMKRSTKIDGRLWD